MKCGQCGRELPEEAEFCYTCGTLIGKKEKKPITKHYLKLSWTWQPMVMATTDDEELARLIFDEWKKKARMPQLVETKSKDGAVYVWYYADKLRDILRMGKKQDVLNMYDEMKHYVLDNGWELVKPEESVLAGRNDYVSLDTSFTKK